MQQTVCTHCGTPVKEGETCTGCGNLAVPGNVKTVDTDAPDTSTAETTAPAAPAIPDTPADTQTNEEAQSTQAAVEDDPEPSRTPRKKK